MERECIEQFSRWLKSFGTITKKCRNGQEPPLNQARWITCINFSKKTSNFPRKITTKLTIYNSKYGVLHVLLFSAAIISSIQSANFCLPQLPLKSSTISIIVRSTFFVLLVSPRSRSKQNYFASTNCLLELIVLWSAHYLPSWVLKSSFRVEPATHCPPKKNKINFFHLGLNEKPSICTIVFFRKKK